MAPSGRTPSSTRAVPPSGVSTRSACPVFWIGREVLRALSTGLAGCPSNGPSGDGPRATLTPCPRSVPPSAIMQVPVLAVPVEVRRLRELQPRARPQGARLLERLAGGEVDAHLLDAQVLPRSAPERARPEKVT